MTPKTAGDRTVYIAKESFTTVLGKDQVNVVGGRTTVREGHPLLRGREMFFRPITVDYEVEHKGA